MCFLADQDDYRQTVVRLSSEGHNVVTVSEIGSARASDEALLEEAHSDNRALVTRDKDFGALVFLRTHARGDALDARSHEPDVSEAHKERNLHVAVQSGPFDGLDGQFDVQRLPFGVTANLHNQRPGAHFGDGPNTRCHEPIDRGVAPGQLRSAYSSGDVQAGVHRKTRVTTAACREAGTGPGRERAYAYPQFYRHGNRDTQHLNGCGLDPDVRALGSRS